MTKMLTMRTQHRNEKETMSPGTAASSGNMIIATAVPLFFENSLLSTKKREKQQEIDQTSQILLSWNRRLFLLGVFGGTVVSGVTYAAQEFALLKYGEVQRAPSIDTDVVERFQYYLVRCFLHLADFVYVLIALGFAWILIFRGTLCVQGLLNDIFHGDRAEHIEGRNLSPLKARTELVMLVCLEGGFLLGERFIDLLVQIMFGVTVPYFEFGASIGLNLTVCYLLIRCYDWGLGIHDIRNAYQFESSIKTEEMEEEFYVQIV
jgi:membrane glycosyltransferase